MSLTFPVSLHLGAAISAVLIGPFALWTRLGRTVRPRWHRAFGYAWLTCMIITVLSALFIHSHELPNVGGFSPLHLLVPLTGFALYRAITAALRGDIIQHRRTMQGTYISACLVAGLFTLLPSRYLGQLVWGQWLGWG
ncbi:DUF2306 domain-containing protein [Herbaspirillum sp. AP02]|uniref:DUF2306 domain-containing protein n=1 Tax=unclassified Herbaspirillum TaxID=2624150 RepID=UPI0018CA8A5F|nr:DUF2306 domain-containing protein [Herbaspirillum sp. AP02]MBG7618147.1 DUF2306 domain-containing protein [Herbaspirillum sp. AP02]